MTNRKDVAEKMKKSKYVQSNISSVYREIKKQLLENKEVLFSGTPCQVNGLKNFLGKEFPNLYTVDIICHGVPSPKLWREHVKYIQQKHGKISNVDFRNKDGNDGNIQKLKYFFKNNKTKLVKNYLLDPYYNAFYNAYTFRECCYNCNYANCNRVGDITLGDYWGVEKFHAEYKKENGVSLILINSDKGNELFHKYIESNTIYEKTNIEYAKKYNQNLNRPAERRKIRNDIYKDMNKKGYVYIVKKWLKPQNEWLIKIKSMIPMDLKKRLLRIFMR